MNNDILTIGEDSVVGLGEDTILSVEKLIVEGVLGGTGTLITNCSKIEGEIQDTVNLCCTVENTSILFPEFSLIEQVMAEMTVPFVVGNGLAATIKQKGVI